MSRAVDERSTRRGSPVASAPAQREVLALTLLWHPDPARVGEVAILDGATRVSRLEPELTAPHARRGAPLDDVHLSRRPFLELVPDAGGRVRVERLVEEATIALDGAALREAITLDRAALVPGVVLELEGRVALLLHRRTPLREGERHGLAGHSAAIDAVRAAIDAAARVSSPVLICGETGTGKELIARALHDASPRAARPFVAVNVAALPTSVAAAALFGHARGAFTGAVEASPGYFREADGGTLFLDEIGAASLEVQAMLLRALEQREIQRVGGSVPEPVDVRLIAATDANLAEACRAGTFREALYHRLAALVIEPPPLRARRDDIARLLLAFTRAELASLGEDTTRLRARTADEPLWLPARFVADACRAAWPGNVRELRNTCRRLVAAHHADDAVPAEALGLAVGAEPSTTPVPPADDERVLATLAAHGWRVGRAAAELGVSRTTLYAFVERSGRVVRARDLERDQITAALAEAKGDLDAAATALGISPRALKLRMKQLEM